MANTAALILKPANEMKGCESYSCSSESHTHVSSQHEFMLTVHNSCSQSSAHDAIGVHDKKILILKSSNCSEIDSTITMEVDDDNNIFGKSGLNKPHAVSEPGKNMEIECEDGNNGTEVYDLKTSEEKICRTSRTIDIEFSGGPLWGVLSICGGRPEMEDAVAVVPQLLQVPSHMFMEDHVNGSTKNSIAHFFGVYDGHGGCQVANYCQKRLHSALIEEIEATESSSNEKKGGENWQDHWKKAFANCFQKVDDEVAGKSGSNRDNSESSIEPLALETVGSTALVAILSQTHIMVANCGDSRAVLCRGKEAMPLSADHKPNREDEWARIEAAGGRVIQWQGYRVLGVLAMSRSIENWIPYSIANSPTTERKRLFLSLRDLCSVEIPTQHHGDRHMKPWIIPEPEIRIVQREKSDECLVLASDGLWDVMTNEEACDIARRRILLWHKKYGNDKSAAKANEVDPAAQYAAEYLSRIALQRESKDNISVIVIDLKPQRKIKREA